MSLTNLAKDIIGYLRAVNVILMLWNIEHFEFPIDNKLEVNLNLHSEELEEILQSVCEVSQAMTIYDDMRSAIDDIISSKNKSFYDREMVDFLLSLYIPSTERLYFTYEDKALFQEELKPILTESLIKLSDLILWARVKFYDLTPDAKITSALEFLNKIFSRIQSIAPSYMNSNHATENPTILERCITNWKEEVVYRVNTYHFDNLTGVEKVIRELS
jgi:hypothetical protein